MTKKRFKKTVKRKKGGKSRFVKTVLAVFTSNPFRGYNFRMIAAQLGIQDKASKELVKNILLDLEQNKDIIQVKRGKYQLNPSFSGAKISNIRITGIVDMKQTGKAYVITDELADDVYIASNNTHHSLNGDKVTVHLFPQRQGRKIEGQIIEIIERAKTQFVGIINSTSKFAFLIPDNTSMPVDIFIPLEKLNGAKNGDKAIAHITDWPDQSNTPFGPPFI